MFKTSDPQNSSFIDQLKRVVEDAINYAQSQLQVLQVQLTSLALSSVLFMVFVALTVLSGVAAFVLLSVALGIWLAHLMGGAGYALLIIGGVYALITIGLGGYAFRWLKNLKS